MKGKVGISITGVADTLAVVKKIQTSLDSKIELLLKEIMHQGVEITKVNVKGISWSVFHNSKTGWYQPSGDLSTKIVGIYDPTDHTALILADSPYAVFVEYGTGVIGAANPHPTGGAYDTNGHGDEGWWYFAEGDSHWTKGQPARAFMYRSYMELKDLVPRIAKEVFGK